MKKHIPNILSALRIILAVSLITCRPLGKTFLIIYVLGGLSDMLDGFLARHWHVESELGAKLDSAADLILVVICLVKLIPIISLPTILWIWIAAIACVRGANLLNSCRKRGRWIMLHTKLNKLTGLLLFLLPLGLGSLKMWLPVTVTCFIATIASIQEGYFIEKGRNGCLSKGENG